MDQPPISDQENALYQKEVNDQIIALFDVDGTLTPARNKISPEMRYIIQNLRKKIQVGIVSGSDMVKQREQLGEDVLDYVDYSFSENGLIAFRGHELIHSRAINTQLGEDKIKTFLNYTLHQLADLEIPIKRGTFIEYRTGMINVSPIGRNCSQKERDEFVIYDRQHKVREQLVAKFREQFKDYNLTFSIGGQISIDVFPNGN